MSINKESYKSIAAELGDDVTLVAVSKTKPVEDILELYTLGHRDFGENYVQELVSKQEQLPKDIRWHFIGHLQSNKVKFIAPFVHLIHGVDSFKLLKEINKNGERSNRTINCLVQVHIAREETKFGLDENELNELVINLVSHPMKHVNLLGLMGMASLTENMDTVRAEFRRLRNLYDQLQNSIPVAFRIKFQILSMGMSGDFKVAIEEGSNMVRIGSLIFGDRNQGT
ncbi:MAG TPA: YggS family pyridoxal phosphate-dependent enzyme [Chitinophagaceae bacterium]|nr:YggS family pyridoxal phosphate-dependent enzyme [Chitinophagaceae bacterium]